MQVRWFLWFSRPFSYYSVIGRVLSKSCRQLLPHHLASFSLLPTPVPPHPRPRLNGAPLHHPRAVPASRGGHGHAELSPPQASLSEPRTLEFRLSLASNQLPRPVRGCSQNQGLWCMTLPGRGCLRGWRDGGWSSGPWMFRLRGGTQRGCSQGTRSL